MKTKTKTQLSKMTKKNLLLHIENMQLRLENDHLETQKENKEAQQILSKYKKGTAENKLETIRSSAGKLRLQMFKLDIPSDSKAKVMSLVDKFMNYL